MRTETKWFLAGIGIAWTIKKIRELKKLRKNEYLRFKEQKKETERKLSRYSGQNRDKLKELVEIFQSFHEPSDVTEKLYNSIMGY